MDALVARGPFTTPFEDIDKKDREDLVYLARLAEQCERYDEMTELMARVVQRDLKSGETETTVLSDEERNILSVAFKNTVGSRRGSWRAFSTIYERKKQKGNEEQGHLALMYKQKVEAELDHICASILNLIDEFILPRVTAPDAKVFYYKMKGDYYRYIAEYAVDEKRKEATDNSHKNYKEASVIAAESLPPTNPIRLGLALNYSVFYFEILNDPTAACQLAKEAFDSAVPELNNVTGDSYRDSTLIMHLLRDNLALWAPPPADAAAAPGADGETGNVPSAAPGATSEAAPAEKAE